MTAIEEALKHLQTERDRLQTEFARLGAELRRVNKAIAALDASKDQPLTEVGQRGRPRGSKLPPETRARMATAQRARWAKAKTQA